MRSNLATKHTTAAAKSASPLTAAKVAGGNATTKSLAGAPFADEFDKQKGIASVAAFDSTIAANDLDALAKGRHFDPHTVLGAHPVKVNGVAATAVRALLPGRDQAEL